MRIWIAHQNLVEKCAPIAEYYSMTQIETAPPPPEPGTHPSPAAAPSAASLEEIQQGWHELTSRVGQLEAERNLLEQENKALKFLLERVIDHRQKSHSELVLLLTGLVSKLQINDIGVIVSRLVEHNTNVSQYLAALVKGTVDVAMPQPALLKTLEQTKRDLNNALKPLVDELIQSGSSFEPELLQLLLNDTDQFYSQRMVRANRCFIKGQVARERVVKDFGPEALVFFNDMTTDPKLNPSPKPEEIVLNFKNDFEALFQQHSAAGLAEKWKGLPALYQSIQRSKTATETARTLRNTFQKISFIIELLHFYENQNTEPPDVTFAQRLPVLAEQLVVTGPQDPLDEKLIAQAESLLAFIINPDHRYMVVNNIGKSGGSGRSLRYVLRLRSDRAPSPEELVEFVKHLIPPAPQKRPTPESIAGVLQLVNADMQLLVVNAIMSCDRLRMDEAEALGRAVGNILGLKGLELIKAPQNIPPEVERQLAWDKIKDLITRRNDPTIIAAAIRERLHAKYDADEIRQSWLTLIEADAISLIRIFCALPYLADGRTDSIARTVMETYVTRLMHEKYATTYNKITNSLRNMFRAKPDSPTLLNFTALVRWVDPQAANKLSADVGMAVPAQ
jgi:hypothetical protein